LYHYNSILKNIIIITLIWYKWYTFSIEKNNHLRFQKKKNGQRVFFVCFCFWTIDFEYLFQSFRSNARKAFCQCIDYKIKHCQQQQTQKKKKNTKKKTFARQVHLETTRRLLRNTNNERVRSRPNGAPTPAACDVIRFTCSYVNRFSRVLFRLCAANFFVQRRKPVRFCPLE
jgi:hypothetical protein